MTSADHPARVLVVLVSGATSTSRDLYLARQSGLLPLEAIEDDLAAHAEAFERILGARPGSLRWIDSATLQHWFG